MIINQIKIYSMYQSLSLLLLMGDNQLRYGGRYHYVEPNAERLHCIWSDWTNICKGSQAAEFLFHKGLFDPIIIT